MNNGLSQTPQMPLPAMQPPEKNTNWLNRNGLLLAVAAMAHIPIAVEYAFRMWRSGHYQFFPLLMLVVGWCYFTERNAIERNTESGDSNVVTMLFTAILGLVTVATMLNSSFVGAISLWLFVATVLYWRLGNRGLRKTSPLLFVLLFIIPLPARIDESLIRNMQFLASQLASWILDGLGFVHFREGVILITQEKQFFTEEACSGIRSLFSSLAGIVLFGIIRQYSWPRHLFNMIQTVVWVIVGNAIRIAAVVLLTDTYSSAFATGVGHDLLGFATFGFILAMAISTDRMLSAVKPPTEQFVDEPIENTIVQQAGWKKFSRQSGLGWRTAVFAGLFVVVFLIGSRLLFVRQTNTMGIAVFNLPRLPSPEEEEMPLKIGDWVLEKFDRVTRGRQSLQAEDSFVWTYRHRGSSLTAFVSLDCPWDKWHDLSNCYSGVGWQTETTHNYSADGSFNDNRSVAEESNANEILTNYSQVNLQKTAHEQGLVLFSAFDRNASEVVPQFTSGFFSFQSVQRQFVANASLAIGLSTEKQSRMAGVSLPVTMVQLLTTPSAELTKEDKRELQFLFSESRKILSKSKRFGQNDQPLTQ